VEALRLELGTAAGHSGELLDDPLATLACKLEAGDELILLEVLRRAVGVD